ncbi:MAG: hypothetical protein IH802_13025 [Nitrospinae bacterium]|nr:hypothetical protein [Nitrospinota bacterium]
MLVIIAGSLSAACEVREDVIAIEHVNVIPLDRERVLEDSTVIVEAGLIRDIEPASEAAVPRGATRIDGSEKFLIPGLVDMHIHLDEQAVVDYVSGLLGLEGTPAPVPVEEILFPYLANGVTAVSLLSGTPGSLVDNAPKRFGPTPQPDNPRFIIIVEEGESAGDIGQKLEEAGVIQSERLFIVLAALRRHVHRTA